jgi:hypothetical protein
MLKKLFKAALTASIVVGMSSAAMAWAPIGDSGMLLQLDTSSTFGQYNSGVEGTAAYFRVKSETNLSWLAMKGDWTVWADIEFDDNGQMHNSDTSPAMEECSASSTSTTDEAGETITTTTSCSVVVGKEMDAVGANISYKVTPEFSVKIGTIHHGNGLQYSLGAGMFTAYANHGGWAWSGWSESEGIGFYYTISPDMSVQVSQYVVGAAAVTGQFPGSAIALDFTGKAGSVAYKVGYLSETHDDPAVEGEGGEGDSNTFTNLGVKVGLGDAMAVSFDYATASILGWTASTDPLIYTDMSLGFSMDGLGPGSIKFFYSMLTRSLSGDPLDATAEMGLIYEIKKGPGRMQIQYASSTATPEGGDGTTASWLGFGYDFKI